MQRTRLWSPLRSLPAALVAGAILGAGIVGAAFALRREHAPVDIQRRLPLLTFFSGLCPDARTSAGAQRQIRREAEVLMRELRRRPGDLVTIEDSAFAEGFEPRDITVRELAEERLQDLTLEREWTGVDCAPSLRRRLEAALGD